MARDPQVSNILYQYKECLWYWFGLTIYFSNEPGQGRNSRSPCAKPTPDNPSIRKRKMPGRGASAVARPAERRQRYSATKFAGTIPSSTRWLTPSPKGVKCGQHGGVGAGRFFHSH